MNPIVFQLTFIVVSFVPHSIAQSTSASPFELLVKGRCEDWGQRFSVANIPCGEIWTQFEAVLTNPDLSKLCTMDPRLFDPVVQLMFQYVPDIYEGSLWSKSKAFVVDVCSRLGLFTCLESTLPGYIFNDLNWCDSKITGGKLYKTQCGCSGKAEMVFAFWKSASSAYSKKMYGSVQAIMNASLPTPFYKNSTFGSVELPNIKPPKITKFTAVLVSNIQNETIRTGCNSPSMLELKSIIEEKQLPYECVEDPPFAIHYQCIRNPKNRRCHINSTSRLSVISLMMLIPVIGVHAAQVGMYM